MSNKTHAWDNETSPLTDKVAIHNWNMPDGTPMQTPMTEYELVVHARDLEKKLSYAEGLLTKLVSIVPRGSCEDFHHTAKDRHADFAPCPPLERHRANISEAHAFLAAAKEEK